MTESQEKPKIVEAPERDFSTGFDYRVHIKDAKTGKLIRIQTYARHSKGGDVLLERPVGSGNCWKENGESAGRWKFTQRGADILWEKLSEQHVAVKPAPASYLEDLQQRNEALEAELAAMRAEAEVRQAQTKGKQSQKD